MTEKFDMVAKTFQGLEGVLADELAALGAENVEQGTRMVAFTGDKEMLYRANFCLRTALRILKPFHKFQAIDIDDLYRQVKAYNWQAMMTAEQTFAIDVTANSEEFRHSRFVTYRVKDAIADHFNEALGRRPSIRVTNPDLRIDVHISGNQVTLSLDSSGEPLYRRGWREGQTDAPINEVLAAGIILLSGWNGQTDLVDPMCGSGTFLVEAALIAANINPGVFRKGFAFQNWADYDDEMFNQIYNDDSGEREFTHKIYGYDIDGKAIAISRANVKSAGVARYVELGLRDIAEWTEAPAGGTLITNPPYGERLKGDIGALYQTLGQKLKHVFTGYNAWLIVNRDEHNDHIGLKPSLTYRLLNGAIECELRQYVIFEGRYSDLRSRGESIKNEGFRASDPNRGRPRREHMGERKPRPRREFSDRGDSAGRPSEPRRPRNFSPREPQLGVDKEVPIIRGRRKSWKRRDLDIPTPPENNSTDE